jgi:enediyne biosynthesis protein E4
MEQKKHISFFAALILIMFFSCDKKPDTLFQPISSGESGITFSNDIHESDTINILTQEYIYNGGGVGVGDFNNDGLSDIFFSGNMVSNKLYLNKGNFEFEDVTEPAGVSGNGQWCSGVALTDINNDGWLDIYVCSTFKKDSTLRKNLLYVNKGKDAQGNISFSEQARAYGIDDEGYSTNAAFFDYDKDGDLDLYVLTNILNEKIPTNFRKKITDGSAINNDRLYRNNGNNTFTNVSKEAGIVYEGYGLGLAIADFDNDSWPDIYVSNDYLSNDILYINQKDGTFVNKTSGSIKHQSMFSMGNDAADFNNDGRVDIVTLDMLGETNFRQKTTMGNKNYLTYINNEKYGYDYQYIRNMLQLNNGLDQQGNVSFSEIGMLAGVYRTDWSWSPLFADVDNDGLKDLLITNGFPKDITDRDFAIYRSKAQNLTTSASLLDSIPVARVPNYAFKNNGDLTFTDVGNSWGLAIPSFSNGAAFADLDNDGDLDYVVNNINDKAFVFKNTLTNSTTEKTDSVNYVRFKLKGAPTNVSAIGTKIILFYNHGMKQFHEHSIYRGYLSTVEDAVHFGLGKQPTVDSAIFMWPDGTIKKLLNPKVNQTNLVSYESSVGLVNANHLADRSGDFLVQDVSAEKNISYRHQEPDIIDFNFQRTLPHKLSQSGPSIAVADINGDGLEDFVVGGSSSQKRHFFLQSRDGKFAERRINQDEKPEEDTGLLFFDADLDGDVDLYAASGSIEQMPESSIYEDKLFLNDGKGNFAWAKSALPSMIASGSCVRASDMDMDGDLDLFVGGRVLPGSYPLPGKSYLLKNNNGVFLDVTEEVSPGLRNIGMVTDALWSDVDNDGAPDLLVVGEFMAVQIFKNRSGKFKLMSSTGLETKIGWWNSIVGADFDRDGDTDYVAGNLGLNNYFHASDTTPLQLVARDFDNNGSIDPILSCYFKESTDRKDRKLYPVHFWDEMNSQSPKFRQQFVNFKHYGRTSTENLFSKDDLKDALILNANYFQSSYIENKGDGKFELHSLPLPAQVAPINGIITDDVNEDGFTDVLLVGNDFGNEIFIGRYDAFSGLILLGDGKGDFKPVENDASNFYVAGDAKAAAKIFSGGTSMYLITQNQNALKVFANSKSDRENVIELSIEDAWVEFLFPDGSKQKTEAYFGCGYLSQSSRKISIPKNTSSVLIFDRNKKSREIENKRGKILSAN